MLADRLAESLADLAVAVLVIAVGDLPVHHLFPSVQQRRITESALRRIAPDRPPTSRDGALSRLGFRRARPARLALGDVSPPVPPVLSGRDQAPPTPTMTI